MLEQMVVTGDGRNDLVIGAVTNYTWDQIKYWCNSLDRSGFKGIKAVVAYNLDNATLSELSSRDYSICCFEKTPDGVRYPEKDFAIVVDRFLHYYLMLNNDENRKKIRYVVATDMKDVVFQKNPSDFLSRPAIGAYGLILSSEGIAYQHEPWGANNLLQSFGAHVYEQHKRNTIVNCGVLAGEFDVFMGLCMTLYLMCGGAPRHVPGGGGPDQAALNLLFNTQAYREISLRTSHVDDWAAQLGTMMDPQKINAYKPFLTEPMPTFTSEGVVNVQGESFTIVHQWDRVPEVKEYVERTYA